MSRRVTLGAAAALILLLAGCASADKHASPGSAVTGMAAGMTMSGTSTGGGASAGAVAGSNASVPGMNMSSTKVVGAHGQITVVPIKTIGTGYWNDMKIVAQQMTPVPFYVYNGAKFEVMKPAPHTSFHLMVMLTDRHSGYPIPYATVWAFIYKNGKIVYNERQWDMLSEYMGPHYGNDVTLPGPGTYTLKVQVSAPVAALHQEYDKMWIGQHNTTSTFVWK